MLNRSATELLFQLQEVIKQCTDDEFIAPVDLLSGATIGQHVRHTLEFFLCLLEAKNTAVVNYDLRKHDRLMETDRSKAQYVIQMIVAGLEQPYPDIEVFFEVNYSQYSAGSNLVIKSSFNRELAYNIEHAIHHMALIKVAIHHKFSHLILPSGFGVASSTARYQATLHAK